MVFGRRNSYKPLNIATVKSRQDDAWNITLKVLYLLLQMIDLCLTVLAVQMGYPELNPFMRAALASIPALLVMKVIIPLLIFWLVPGKYLIPAVALLVVIVGWNIKELLFLAL